MGVFDKVKEISGSAKDAYEKHGEEKAAELIAKYGLNVGQYSMQDITDENTKNIKTVDSELKMMSAAKLVAALKMDTADQAMIGYMKALTEQNWIIIRQNEAMLRLLAKLSK